MAKDYSNRELDQFLKAANERADEFHGRLMDRMDAFEAGTKGSLGRIEAQVAKTNGRVTKLEKFQLILATAVFVILVLKFPDLAALFKLL